MNAEDVLLTPEELAKGRREAAAFQRRRPALYADRQFPSRAEQFQQDYARRGPASFLGPEPPTAEKLAQQEADERVATSRAQRQRQAFFANLTRLREATIRERIRAGETLYRATVLELTDGLDLIASGRARVFDVCPVCPGGYNCCLSPGYKPVVLGSYESINPDNTRDGT